MKICFVTGYGLVMDHGTVCMDLVLLTILEDSFGD